MSDTRLKITHRSPDGRGSSTAFMDLPVTVEIEGGDGELRELREGVDAGLAAVQSTEDLAAYWENRARVAEAKLARPRIGKPGQVWRYRYDDGTDKDFRLIERVHVRKDGVEVWTAANAMTGERTTLSLDEWAYLPDAVASAVDPSKLCLESDRQRLDEILAGDVPLMVTGSGPADERWRLVDEMVAAFNSYPGPANAHARMGAALDLVEKHWQGRIAKKEEQLREDREILIAQRDLAEIDAEKSRTAAIAAIEDADDLRTTAAELALAACDLWEQRCLLAEQDRDGWEHFCHKAEDRLSAERKALNGATANEVNRLRALEEAVARALQMCVTQDVMQTDAGARQLLGAVKHILASHLAEQRERYLEARRRKAPEPGTAAPAPEKCPTCASPAPHLHPAVQEGGEVQPCRDDFHRRVTPQNPPTKIAENDAFLKRTSARVVSCDRPEGAHRNCQQQREEGVCHRTTCYWYRRPTELAPSSGKPSPEKTQPAAAPKTCNPLACGRESCRGCPYDLTPEQRAEMERV